MENESNTTKEGAGRYRKLPVEIEAVQWNGDNEIEIMNFVGKKLSYDVPPRTMDLEKDLPNSAWSIFIPTLEGTMTANKMDWIIKGVNGEFYPCKPDIFQKTYEPAHHPSTSSPSKELIEKIGEVRLGKWPRSDDEIVRGVKAEDMFIKDERELFDQIKSIIQSSQFPQPQLVSGVRTKEEIESIANIVDAMSEEHNCATLHKQAKRLYKLATQFHPTQPELKKE